MENKECNEKLASLIAEVEALSGLLERKDGVIQTLLEEKKEIKEDTDKSLAITLALKAENELLKKNADFMNIKFLAMEKLYLGKIASQKEEIDGKSMVRKETMSQRIFGSTVKELSPAVQLNKVELSEIASKPVVGKIELSDEVPSKVKNIVSLEPKPVSSSLGSNLDKRI